VCVLTAFLWIFLVRSLTSDLAFEPTCDPSLTLERVVYWGGSAALVLLAVVLGIRRYRRRHVIAVALYVLAVLVVGVAMFASRRVIGATRATFCGG
jgi:hypothetical protein